MTSSFRLKKRIEEADTWSFGDISDHYLSEWGVCHPNYTAIPIGRQNSEIKICVKRKNPDGTAIDTAQPSNMHKLNGFYRFSADLYHPERERPVQITNPSDYFNRRIPNEKELYQKDYIQRPPRYNSTGIQQTRSPGQERFYEYAFDIMEHEHQPPKYDVTRFVQPYDIWKRAQEYHGRTPNPDHNMVLLSPI